MHDLWCITARHCRTPVFRLDDLKRDDPSFGSHMDWMRDKERAAKLRRRRDVMETAFKGKPGGSHE
jgi:hypothetical protein